MTFDRKVALVTGAGAGMGTATALEFAAQGARVAVVDLRLDAANDVADKIRAGGGEAVAIAADVSVETDVARMVAETVATLGSLDCAVNNAAVPPDDLPLHEADVERMRRVIEVDLLGVAVCLKHELAHMRGTGRGTIVNIGSVSSLRPHLRNAAYVGAKHGVIGLTKVAAQENAELGIRVNTVLPGSIETPMLRAALEDNGSDPAEAAKRLSSLGRFGHAEEVARASVWLCSDAASYITGAHLPVDGGFTSQ